MNPIKKAIKSYDGIVNIKKEFEQDHNALNRELVLALCDQVISWYKLEIDVPKEDRAKIRTLGKKFSIVSEGSPFTTNLYYDGEKIPYVKKIITSVDVEDPALRAEVVLNLDGSDCDLEVDPKNMTISFGNERFKLIPIKGK